MPPPDRFLDQTRLLQIDFEPGDVERLGEYLALLLEANTRFNLTAITDPDEAWIRHILDSLTLFPYIASGGAKRVIDVGSGGGLPGVPLAITLPQVEFALVEATGKKARFLHDTAEKLNLGNVTIVNERAETIGQDRRRFRERYDLAVARAVGKLPVLLELTAPLVKVGGQVLAIKGERVAEEIAVFSTALHRLRCDVVAMICTPINTLVIIEKRAKTPSMYPRAPGVPRRLPLGARRGKPGKK